MIIAYCQLIIVRPSRLRATLYRPSSSGSLLTRSYYLFVAAEKEKTNYELGHIQFRVTMATCDECSKDAIETSLQI